MHISIICIFMHCIRIYEMVYFSHCTAPQPPSGIMVTANGCNSAMVSWNASQSRMCDVVVVSYSVRYRLTGSSDGYDTVSTSNTSATLENLVPNAEYDVEVATVDSDTVMSAYSTVTQLSMQGNSYMCSISVLFHVVVVVDTSSHLRAVSVQLLCLSSACCA